MPLWLLTVGTRLFPGVEIPFHLIAQSFATYLGPFLLGLLLYHFVPKCRGPIFTILRPTNIIMLLLSMTTLFVTRTDQLRFFTLREFFCSIVIFHGSLFLSLLLGWGTGFKKSEFIPIALMTPLKNLNLIEPVVLSVTRQPFADVWTGPVSMILNVIPITILPYIIYVRKCRPMCQQKCGKHIDAEKDTEAGKEDHHGNTDIAIVGGEKGYSNGIVNGHVTHDVTEGMVNEAFENSRL